MRSYIGKSDVAVLILTGLGGSEDGYNGKYVDIATKLKDNHGASVFVFSTPSGAWEKGEDFLRSCLLDVDKLMKLNGKKDYIVYAMGSSAGASILASYSYKFPKIKKVLALNPVIHFLYNKLQKGLECSTAVTKVFVGENDQSMPYFSLISKINRENLEVATLPNVDHVFSGEQSFNLFLKLPEKIFFEN